MAWGSNKLHLTYDSIGPASVTYNGVKYFYLKNAQGDVTGLVNASGTQVVSYTYDPWGAPMSTDGTMASTLGAANPLRYRGYVYDTETGLYYLNSRYYNPVWGRFINADTADVVATCGKKSPLWEILFFVAHSFLAVLQSVLQCYQLLQLGPVVLVRLLLLQRWAPLLKCLCTQLPLVHLLAQ